jgi:hypothetical protein
MRKATLEDFAQLAPLAAAAARDTNLPAPEQLPTEGGGETAAAGNSNPTSTGIYRRLGFAPEFVHRTWRFE